VTFSFLLKKRQKCKRGRFTTSRLIEEFSWDELPNLRPEGERGETVNIDKRDK
jgi:hypothetical protein